MKPWKSDGLRAKPENCHLCGYSQIGHGFVADLVPFGAKMAFVFGSPYKDDVLQQLPGSSGFGPFIRRDLIEAHGRASHEVALCNVMRCLPPWRNGEPAYPTGYLRKQAESNCRYFDHKHGDSGKILPNGIAGMQINCFLLTLDPQKMIATDAFRDLIIRDVQKAWRLVEKGYKPAVLFGQVPMDLVAGHLQGGIKQWRGHWWETEGWPVS